MAQVPSPPITSRRLIIAVLGVLGVYLHDSFGVEITDQGVEWITLLTMAWIGGDSIRETIADGKGKVVSLFQSSRFWAYIGGLALVTAVEFKGVDKFDIEQLNIVVAAICTLIVGDALRPINKNKQKEQIGEQHS